MLHLGSLKGSSTDSTPINHATIAPIYRQESNRLDWIWEKVFPKKDWSKTHTPEQAGICSQKS